MTPHSKTLFSVEKNEDVAGNDDCVKMNDYEYDDEMPVG